MLKIRVGGILSIMFISIFFLITNLRAEVVDEDKVKEEVNSAFTQYTLALKLEDYGWAFSLEPHFIQKAVGDTETYKSWWSRTPYIDEWRRLYSELGIKKIGILTPKRAAILPYSPDERLTTAAFYAFLEDGKWKIVSFEIVFIHTKKELKKLKDSIKQFYEKNGGLPESLSKLTPEYIATLPVDLFNDKEEPYRYVKEENGNFKIYSFGPDSDDDLGMAEYDYYKNGLLSNGDIIVNNANE